MKINILRIDNNQCPLILLASLNQWGMRQDPQYIFSFEEVDFSGEASSRIVAKCSDFELSLIIKKQDFPLSLELFVKLIKSSLKINSSEQFVNILPTARHEAFYCLGVLHAQQRFSMHLTAKSFWKNSQGQAFALSKKNKIKLRFPLKVTLDQNDTQTCVLKIIFPSYMAVSKQNFYIEPSTLEVDLKLMNPHKITFTLTLGEIEISLKDMLNLKVGSELTLDLPKELFSSDFIVFGNKLAKGQLLLESQKIKFLITQISQ